MVSKVAVVALVAIIAVPILLGYGFNLSEVTVTDYAPEGDSVNVTPLLKNGTAYSDTNSDTYSINTNFSLYDKSVYPVYTTSLEKSALPMDYFNFTAGDYYSSVFNFANYTYFFFKSNGDGNGYISYSKLNAGDNSVINTYNDICTWDWNLERGTVQFTVFNASKTAIANSYEFGITNPSDYGFQFTPHNGYSSTGYAERLPTSGTTKSADFSKGYYFPHPVRFIDLQLPENTKSILMTIDLNSIQDSSYAVRITPRYNGYLDLVLMKSTVNGVVKWTVTNLYNNDQVADLYYDPNRADNTYQLVINVDRVEGNDWNYHVEFRYIGSWPLLMGAANYYQKYEYDYRFTYSINDMYMDELQIGGATPILRTPLFRMDGAVYAGFAYDTIMDQTYTPADFKTNPTTTINVQSPGSSLQFGGNTYTVDSDGNITLGTHKVSVYKMKFDSIPTAGGYENRINGTAVSVTAQPSTIKFNGQWGTTVSTVANAATTYTKTEWIAGEFAWDGIDDNFLMVGLLTSLGVFIALGIYSRRSKFSVWPLMLVAGGATFLFLIMM